MAPKRRGVLSDLRLNEVALCERGMNPGAAIVLYKRRTVAKQEDDPRTFEEAFEASRLMEIDSALDRRLHALLATTTDIMRSDVDNREALILDAVGAYAATMNRDVPELFAGRLAKWLTAWAPEIPTPNEIETVVVAELEKAGLSPDDDDGGNPIMEWLTKLSEGAQRALKYILGDRDPAEVFKGIGDDGAAVVGALLGKSAEWAAMIDALTEEVATAKAELAKALKQPTDPNSLDSVLKSIADPGVRAYLETQDAALKKTREETNELRKSARTKELTGLVKALPHLPNEGGALLALLEKADGAGLIDDLEKVLVAANAQAKLGKAYEELGLETLHGEGSVGTVDEADAALVAKAAELRQADASLTAEQAYDRACTEHPDLYNATRQYRPGTIGAH